MNEMKLLIEDWQLQWNWQHGWWMESYEWKFHNMDEITFMVENYCLHLYGWTSTTWINDIQCGQFSSLKPISSMSSS